jgi:hypothetical protein
MLSKQIGTIEHMTCGCGRGASLMAVNVGGGITKYKAEALCCHMQTVLLLTPQAATAEFGRLRAVIQMDLDAFTAMEKAYAERKTKVRNIRGPK